MMKTTYMKYIGYAITAVVLLLYGCVSERDTVSVRQVVSERPIILRIKKDKTTVFSISCNFYVQEERQKRHLLCRELLFIS